MIVDATRTAQQLRSLLAAGRTEEVLRGIASAVLPMPVQPEFFGKALFIPALDELVQEAGMRIASEHPALKARFEPTRTILYIATELYEFGGHTRVIEQIVRTLREYQHVIAVTDLAGNIASGKLRLGELGNRFRELGATIVLLRPDTMTGKLSQLLDVVASTKPAAVFLVAHHPDVVAFAAANPLLDVRTIFIHHADHLPSLGASIGRYLHVDHFPTHHARCSQFLATPPIHIPLSSVDHGIKSFSAPETRNWSTVTSGGWYKFYGASRITYSEALVVILRHTKGAHYHIGEIPGDALDAIRAAVAASGIDQGRFCYVGWVQSVWRTLKEIDAHMYVASFPSGGGLAGIEAMGAGYPIVYARLGGPLDFLQEKVYFDEARSWSSTEELVDALDSIARNHQHFSTCARHHFDTYHSQSRFAARLRRLLAIPWGNVPAITTRPNAQEVIQSESARALQSGLELRVQGRFAEAVQALERALRLDPGSLQARNELATLYFMRGDALAAVGMLREALLLAPESSVLHNDLVLRMAEALAALGDVAGACEQLLSILEKDAEHGEALYRLGNLRMRQGAWAEARKCHEKVLRALPTHYGATHNLGRVLQEQGDLHAAMACFERAASLSPGSPDPPNNRGVCLQTLERHDEAIVAFEAALRVAPDHLESQNNLAVSLFRLGRSAEAVQHFRRLVARAQGSAAANSNLLMALGARPDIAPQDLFREHQRYNLIHALPLASQMRVLANAAQPDRRLRVGYVCPDFRLHPTMNFLEPLLTGHDRDLVELYGYFTSNQADAVTDHVRQMFERWLPAGHLGDQDLADRIRADGVDILVDVAGHGSNSRLLTFARKPAPVQVTWLGYCISTGLTAIDYRFSDRFFDPENEPLLSSEAVCRLPIYRVYKPLFNPGLDVSRLPAAANGHLTFGSFNNYSKVNDETVALWCEVLHELRDARLIVVSNDGGAIARAAVLSRFNKHGIAPERIEVLGRLPMDAYHRLYHKIDVMLDPFPFPGATTTFDSLWMGVPPITLVTDSRVSRAGEGILVLLGMQEWIARDRSEYVAIARRAARDTDSLATLRRSIRQQLADSPLMDAEGFARSVESAYRDIWNAWCEQRNSGQDTIRGGGCV